MHDAELRGWLRLLLTPYVGSVAGVALLKKFGLPSSIFDHSLASLQSSGLGLQPRQLQALSVLPKDFEVQLERTQQWLAGSDRNHVLTLADVHYPQQLLHIADPPLLLFAIADATALSKVVERLNNHRALAMVGSRRATPQGVQNARAFAHSLVSNGYVVASGLALGIDAASHQGAIDAGLSSTVAVVGTGLDRVYPAKNKQLAHDIVDKGGVLFSEFPLGTSPIARNFPKRNRLLAGMSVGTLVVEANVQSGSLITARLAAEMGKEVFAIPGSIHSPQAKGCHLLIKQGAKLVESTDDILTELQGLQHAGVVASVPVPNPNTQVDTDIDATGSEAFAPEPADEEKSPILSAMGYDPIHIDELSLKVDMTMGQLQTCLFDLELENQVKRLPGGLFQRHVVT